jgi:hypothetical protein
MFDGDLGFQQNSGAIKTNANTDSPQGRAIGLKK